MYRRAPDFNAVLLALAALVAVAAGVRADPVTLTQDAETVTLDNGIVRAVIKKSRASIMSLRYREIEMLKDGYYSMDGGADYRNPRNCTFRVKQASPEMIDIAFNHKWTDEPQALDIEMHYVLRQGDSGIYCYALLNHPAEYPEGHYGEWRFVWKLNDDTLERIYVDDVRQWEMPSSTDTREPTPIKEITRLTSGVRAGLFDCKYEFAESYYTFGTWGHASNRNQVGAFIVLGSQEYLNDGPTKHDLTAAAGINHMHFGMNHFAGSTVKVPAGTAWRKMYGPFLLYVNHKPTADECWADAKARVATERAAWPYEWLKNNPDYPSQSDRGTVSGRFVVSDALKPSLTSSGAWIGLSQPDEGGNWQLESMRYQYWSRVDADGSFSIPHVRPGTYTLSAFVDGAVGEYQQKEVAVSKGSNSLGTITWNVLHKGSRLAWELGTPDRRSKEFFHGSDYFRAYNYLKFADELPNPIEFTIGKSDPAKDWNYAQARYADGSQPNRWNIHFTLDSLPKVNATLTAAIASAERASISVEVNGEMVGKIEPAIQGGNALLRQTDHAKYCVEYLPIPISSLKAGENTISLVFPARQSDRAHVMYDYLNLETE